jgi:FkbM family methyltransferase
MDIERTLNIGGIKYSICSDDSYLERQSTKDFEPDILKLFEILIKPDAVVLDIGANIGCTAVFFSSKAREVTAFEPSPSTFGFLSKNLAKAGCKNVTLVNAGLGKDAAQLTLTSSESDRSGAFVSNQIEVHRPGYRTETISILKGDDFASRFEKLDFIKIDVEGFEKDVIEGLSETIKRLQPVVALELNHWCLNAFQRIAVPDFFDFLRSVFPVLFAVDKGQACDLHDPNAAFHVMYHHINGGKFPTIVGAQHSGQVSAFLDKYVPGEPEPVRVPSFWEKLPLVGPLFRQS